MITFGKNLNLDRLRGTYEYVKDRDSVSIFPLLAKRDSEVRCKRGGGVANTHSSLSFRPSDWLA